MISCTWILRQWKRIINYQKPYFFVENYKKLSTLGLVPKHWPGFSYIHSEYYKLDLNSDGIIKDDKAYNFPPKQKTPSLESCSCYVRMLSNINLNGGDTFTATLIN